MEKESYQMKLEFHHINYVSEDADRLHKFYTEVLGMTDIPAEHFPRPKATGAGGYSGKIKFATDGGMQMHLAEKDLNVAFKNKAVINPVEKGHIAFRADDIDELKEILTANKIPYSDYGTAFAKEWHQVFFYDPEGNVIEVHQAVEPKEQRLVLQLLTGIADVLGCGHLLSRIDLDDLSHKTAKLNLEEIEELIVLVPQRNDYDEEFPTTVTSWDEVRHFGQVESINVIPVAIGDLLKAKTRGER